MSAKLPFGKTLVLRKCLEKKQLETLTSELKPNGKTIAFMEQNSRWCSIINVDIGMRNGIRALANYMLNFGKSITIGCWRIGKVKIWDIT